MNQFQTLFSDSCGNTFVAVTDVADRNTGSKIEKFAPFIIPQAGTLSTDEELFRCIGRDDELVEPLDGFFIKCAHFELHK